MSEWFKVSALKTDDGRPSVGSNPTIAAKRDLKYWEDSLRGLECYLLFVQRSPSLFLYVELTANYRHPALDSLSRLERAERHLCPLPPNLLMGGMPINLI
jgi:hypothetical protein